MLPSPLARRARDCRAPNRCLGAAPVFRRPHLLVPGRATLGVRRVSSQEISHYGACPSDPHPADGPADLGWCIRRQWRVLYLSYRHAVNQPLRLGMEEFEMLMGDVLWRLCSALTPAGPPRRLEFAIPEEDVTDVRHERVYRPSGRVF